MRNQLSNNEAGGNPGPARESTPQINGIHHLAWLLGSKVGADPWECKQEESRILADAAKNEVAGSPHGRARLTVKSTQREHWRFIIRRNLDLCLN